MKIYGAPQSSSSRRALVTAAHLGIDFELVPMDLRQPEVRARLCEINPNNKIPVLEDGDVRLWESHAIMQYLCERTPGQTLYPDTPAGRADVNRWLFWSSAHMSPAVGGLSFERLWKKQISGADADPAMVAYHERFLHQFAKVADDHLAKRAWLSGDALTLADISIAATLMYRKPAQLPLEDYKHLVAWTGRIYELDAWKRTEPAGTWA